MLLICLADNLYGYYQFVRFATTAALAYLAYECFKSKENGIRFCFVTLALLFQPFFKVALGRTIWNVVAVIAVIAVLFLFVRYKIRNKESYMQSNLYET